MKESHQSAHDNNILRDEITGVNFDVDEGKLIFPLHVMIRMLHTWQPCNPETGVTNMGGEQTTQLVGYRGKKTFLGYWVPKVRHVCLILY